MKIKCSSRNIILFFILLLLALLTIRILFRGLDIHVNLQFDIHNNTTIKNIQEHFNTNTKADKADKTVKLVELNIDNDLLTKQKTMRPNDMLVTLFINENIFDGVKVELRKMIGTFANAPITAYTTKHKQFINNILKFNDVQMLAEAENNYITVLTRKGYYKLDGLINNTDKPFDIVIKIINYFGLQTDYQ